MKKNKSFLMIGIVGIFFFAVTILCWFLPNKDFSDSERRKLAQKPNVTIEKIADGSFMTDFESYTLDQFPLRDTMRSIKAFFSYNIMRKTDNNSIYVADGYAAKLEYPLNENSISHALDRFQYVYDTYLKDNNTNIYTTVVPDKGYYLADKNGILSMDYDKLFSMIKDGMSYSQYIDIKDKLCIEDYYTTDTHWKQENIVDVANTILDAMGSEKYSDFEENVIDKPFYGVYYGQSALPLPSEKVTYLTNNILDSCTVINGEKNTEMNVYDMSKVDGKDLYEIYLGGSISLITIENPSATTDKTLIIFRDSFGSSISPLLTAGYAKTIVIDIRYLAPQYLEKFVDFKNSDVLFLYSTLVLNNSETIK